MAIAWPKKPRLIGTKTPRLDGPDKATGHAKYSFDINRPGMLHARILRCPYAHAKLKSLDTADAEKMPGVKAVHVIAKAGTELFYAGDEVVALAADTEEHVHDALRAIKAKYEVLDHVVQEDELVKEDGSPREKAKDKKTLRGQGNLIGPSKEARGKVEDAFEKADAVVEGLYGVSVICHQCLESHGLVAEWDKDGGLTVWCSTQATYGTADGLRQHFGLEAGKVKCITHYMGGGFGSKFGPDIQGITAAELARKAGAPVKLMLDRAEEVTAGGIRPSGYGKVKIAGTKDGTITAYQIGSYGTSGVSPARTVGGLPYVYDIANTKAGHTVVRVNAQGQRAMRAPGHPQSCFLTEGPIDDLAAKLGLDPLQVRLKNLPQNDQDAVKSTPQSYNALRNTIYQDEIKKAAELAQWDKKWHPPGQGKGTVKHGIGMAIHTWGGAAGKPNEISVTISRDGSVLVQASTQDLGTGERTVLPIIVAEILGLEVKDITVQIGESPYGSSSGSGGSTTCPGTAPPTLQAALAARDALLAKIAPRLDSKAEQLSIGVGKIRDKDGNKSWSWQEACAKLGRDTVKGQGQWGDDQEQDPLVKAGLSNNGVGGVQIAEVAVDTETGVVRVTRIVAVQDCGLIINKQGCESQVAGGVIMGLNYALFEQRIMDRHTGRQVNPDMEFYKLGGIRDMPEIIVHMHDMPDRGVIGIGEPPTISTCAAIGNAIHNAIGVRVPFTPFSPEHVLAALEGKKGGRA
ncbi:MAG TPA: xanthine dehydrogenase family protein molybdopterin-binding subunit [Gemmataceae bacterium]|jgi:xanthine dehydrogenase YagR molybdenum-binding subunit|nr:xanthine dehydrogenase family protein molybdopterin-binding subunit [Gemmataceae bacterium]